MTQGEIDVLAADPFDGVALAATLTALLYWRTDSGLSRWLAVALTASLLGELFAAAGGTGQAFGRVKVPGECIPRAGGD